MRKLGVIYFLVFMFFACRKEKLITSLPEATQTGRRTLGFVVEGKVWVPQWATCTLGENCIELEARYDPARKRFEIAGGIKIKDKKSYFDLSLDSLQTTGSYRSTGTISISDRDGLFIPYGGEYEHAVAPNTITITRLDTAVGIISGQFSARLRKRVILNTNLQDIFPNAPDSIEIKEGRFDCRY